MRAGRFSPQALRRFATAVYTAHGMPEPDAALVADALVQADLWGHPSHGVMRTFWYAERLKSGATKAVSAPRTVVDGGAVAVIDGGDGVGQVIAEAAMRDAIERSRRHGLGAVAVRNSGHFGTAMYFTRLAALAGCVGFMATNASPAMAPWGGRLKSIGNNPWSIAAPAGRFPPMMLDIANTAVARGKLYHARQSGEPIPAGWATDSDGRPTTDASAGIVGNILPMAGHKGYAVALMMDVLAGVLSGSRFGADVIGPYEPEGRSGVGHMIIVMNISAFRDPAAFQSDMETLVAGLKAAPRAPGVDEIFYPGEPEARADAQHRAAGLALPDDTLAALNEGVEAMGLPGLRADIE